MTTTQQQQTPDHPAFRPVVIAPTYNNAAPVIGVLGRIERVGTPIIVVDDGATDETPLLLARWARQPHEVPVQLMTHPENRGKAAALRTGFAQAKQLNFTHAVTIDTDGQLEPEDIPALLAAAAATPDALVLGRRAEDTPGMPKSNLVGWYTSGLGVWGETGVVVRDNQCGLRVYPLRLFDVVHCWAGRFGFEAEIIARAVWAGCPLVEVPVDCHYPPREECVSHLKPWRDGAKGFFMHWGLAIRRLVPWPEPKLEGIDTPSNEFPSDVDGSRSMTSAIMERRATAKPARFTDHESQSHQGGYLHAHPGTEPSEEPQRPSWSGVVRTPESGWAAWCLWASPFWFWRQIRSSRMERLFASAGFAHGLFMACMPFGLWAFVAAAYGSKRLHHNLWPAMLGAAFSIPPIGGMLARTAITIIYVPTHFALPDFTAIPRGAHYVGPLFRAYPVSWCLGGALLGTLLFWGTIGGQMWLLRGVKVRER